MQSYEHHVVHESLEMRHPYIQDGFTSEIDPEQVSPMPNSPLTNLTHISIFFTDHYGSFRPNDCQVQGRAAQRGAGA